MQDDVPKKREVIAVIAMAAFLIRGEHSKDVPALSYSIADEMIKQSKENE